MATRNSAREGRQAPAKGATQTPVLAGPTVAQIMVLLLDKAIHELTGLEKHRVSDADWDEIDIDVDNTVSLALEACQRLTGTIDPDHFVSRWFFIASSLNLAEKCFSRPGSVYARFLAGAVRFFILAPEILDFAQRDTEVTHG